MATTDSNNLEKPPENQESRLFKTDAPATDQVSEVEANAKEVSEEEQHAHEETPEEDLHPVEEVSEESIDAIERLSEEPLDAIEQFSDEDIEEGDQGADESLSATTRQATDASDERSARRVDDSVAHIYRSRARFPVLPHHEQLRLVALAKGGADVAVDAAADAAVDGAGDAAAKAAAKAAASTLVNHSYGLVIWCARRYCRSMDPEFADLVQEGQIGLLEAINKFDSLRGVRFATFAIGWILRSMIRYIDQKGPGMHIPVHKHEGLRKIAKSANRLQILLEREPTVREICADTDLSEGDFNELMELADRQNRMVSLDGVSSDSDEELFDLHDQIEDKSARTEALAERNELIQASESLIAKLPKALLREVIERRLGPKRTEPETFREIGKQLGLSPQEAQRKEIRGLDQLRAKATDDLRKLLE